VGSAYDNTARGPSLFYLMATPAEGHNPDEIEAALKAEVARIASDGVSEEELKRARAQLVAGQVYKRDSMFAQAMEIGQLAIVGLSYKDVDTMIAKLQKVTAADVQRVAKQYFNDDSLTVGLLEPQALDGTPRRRGPVGNRH
jgi:zinc protease